jgi:conjugal transfer pilin signal peptidase TrbI
MNHVTTSPEGDVVTSNERGKFAALFFATLLLAWAFWSKPLFTIGFDPQSERCLPNLHLALLVHLHPAEIHDGDLLFWKPSGALAGFKEHFILKEVAGVPGDRLVIHGGRVDINGRTVVSGFPLAHYYGRAEKDFARDEVIPQGEFFMVGVHPLSNDSRYWGYLSAQQIAGFAWRLF